MSNCKLLMRSRKDFIKNFIDEDNALSMLGDLSMPDVNRTDTIIRVEKKNYIITDEYQTIGRVPLSDIPLTDVISNGGSRLHAFIRRFGQFVVIIDVGSFFGIKCKARSDISSPRQHSLPKSRRPLIFKSNETVILELGSVVAVLNPLPCNIMSSTSQDIVILLVNVDISFVVSTVQMLGVNVKCLVQFVVVGFTVVAPKIHMLYVNSINNNNNNINLLYYTFFCQF